MTGELWEGGCPQSSCTAPYLYNRVTFPYVLRLNLQLWE